MLWPPLELLLLSPPSPHDLHLSVLLPMFVRVGFSGITHISVIHPGHLQGKQEMLHGLYIFLCFLLFSISIFIFLWFPPSLSVDFALKRMGLNELVYRMERLSGWSHCRNQKRKKWYKVRCSARRELERTASPALMLQLYCQGCQNSQDGDFRHAKEEGLWEQPVFPFPPRGSVVKLHARRCMWACQALWCDNNTACTFTMLPVLQLKKVR